MTTTEPIRAALADCIEATDNISPSEDIGIFDGSGRWISLITVGDLRALAATTPAPSAEVRETIVDLLKWVEPIAGDNRDDAAAANEIITVERVKSLLSSGLVAPARGDWNEAIEAAASDVERRNWPCVGDARRIAVTIRSLHRGAKESDGVEERLASNPQSQVTPGPSDSTQETVTR